MGRNCLLGKGFYLRDGNIFELDRGVGLHNIVNVSNATELLSLK